MTHAAIQRQRHGRVLVAAEVELKDVLDVLSIVGYSTKFLQWRQSGRYITLRLRRSYAPPGGLSAAHRLSTVSRLTNLFAIPD